MVSSLQHDNRRNRTNGRTNANDQIPGQRYHIFTENHSSQTLWRHNRETSHRASHDQARRHGRQQSEVSQELEFTGDRPTRESLVDGMLQSLNGLPGMSGLAAPVHTYETSFPNGEFRPSFDISENQRNTSSKRPTEASDSQGSVPSDATAHQDAPLTSPRRPSHKRRHTASSIRSKFSTAPKPLSNEERRQLATTAAQAKSREAHGLRNRQYENLKQLNMDAARSGSSRDESPSGDFDLNPQDHTQRQQHFRSRSRSYNPPSSVLNRARPVPPEYHVFEEGMKAAGDPRNTLRKATSHPQTPEKPVPLPRPPSFAERGGFNTMPSSDHSPHRDSLSSRPESPALTRRGRAVDDGDGADPMLASQGMPLTGSFTSATVRSQAEGGTSRQKERPGFFRRMFSSKTSSISDLKQHTPQQAPPVTESQANARRSQAVHEYNTSKANPVPPPPPPPIPVDEGEKQIPPQQLRQKTSFFRRRRKTLTKEEMSQVPLPPAVPGSSDQTPPPPHGGVPVQASDRASESSLRQAMNTYITEPSPRRRPPDPYDIDAELERVDDEMLSPSRRRPEQQSALEFLRSTSPGGVVRQKPARNQTFATSPQKSPLTQESHHPSTSPKAHQSRPSASAKDESKAETSAVDDPVSSNADDKPLARKPSDAPAVLTTASRRRSATSPAAASDEPNVESSQDPRSQSPAVPKIDTSLPVRRSSHQQSHLPAETAPQDGKSQDSWLLSASTTQRESLGRDGSGRVWVQSGNSDEHLPTPVTSTSTPYVEPAKPTVKPTIAAETSPLQEDFRSAKSESSVQCVHDDDQEEDVVSPLPRSETYLASTSPEPGYVSDLDRARRIFEAQNDPRLRAQGALELGEAGPAAEKLRHAFMSFFDFAGLNILLALRDLCARMILKGETQQMDRIMSAFSRRWCECNPQHGFKSEDVVHTICYSLLLLNTDLHVAELTDRMTRNQFVKNTIPTLLRVAEADTHDPDTTLKPTRAPSRAGLPFPEERSHSVAEVDTRLSVEDRGAASRLSNKRLLRPTSEIPAFTSPGPYDVHPMDASELLVNQPHEGNFKSWGIALETVLKEFYLSIRQLKLPLYGSEEVAVLHEQPSSNSLSIVTNMMRRTGSVISKTPSEDSRGRASTFRSAASRFTSKNRSRPRLYPASTFGSSRTASRTSLEDGNLWSPSASSLNSQSKTLTTMSSDSLTPRFPPNDAGYQQSIGFANALSHVIVREEGASIADNSSHDGAVQLLEDESLELLGAPWAKEGILQHKHHLETEGKKARDRNWSECFAVIQRGTMRLFSFNTKSQRGQQKSKPAAKAGAVVGGGNWLENAESLGTFALRHTIANALPPPGYSKQRPHVFALSLPTGAVHLFHVGTAEIAQEFVITANYWSARLSKEPLVGGVSSIEYGWGESVINNALTGSCSVTDVTTTSTTNKSVSNQPPSSFHLPSNDSSSGPAARTSSSGDRSLHSPTPSASVSVHNGISERGHSSQRPSISGSLRSSFDTPRPAAFRNRLPADRLVLGSWQPPQQSIMASKLPEADQLAALKAYIASIEDDLTRHNELRPSVVLAFSPRSVNATKAMGNWERKSHYLLREIVKFRTYIDVLEAAQTRQQGLEKGKHSNVDSAVGKDGEVIEKQPHEEDSELSEETVEALRFARSRGRTNTSASKA